MAERLSYSASMAIGACLAASASRREVTASCSPRSLILSSSPRRCLTLRSSSALSFNPLRSFERLEKRGPSSSAHGAMYATCVAASDVGQLRSAREDIKELLKTAFCHPILVCLGWHDAELKHAANAGLVNALKFIQPIKDKYPGVTYADLFQLASATAVEEAGGPKVPMKYGRVDVSGPEQCPQEGKLPDAGPPSPSEHLRIVFYRMGLNDQDIVALSGAHTLGRSRPERSRWGKPETKYTKEGPGAPGGQSWTVQWLKFDNSYFKDIKDRRDEDLLVLPTDAALFDDSLFKVYAEKYAEDQDAFFKDYA